ncbi:MAG: arsenate reductase (azurin) small subunit [Dehalococcoidia bacterium]|jgi:arsenite oxidase small subunit|nr:arsenate reductase (azurin) small subunit [Dehalococcoidia bacterium]
MSDASTTLGDEDHDPDRPRHVVNRRDFLTGLGYSAGGVVVGLTVGGLVESRSRGGDEPGGGAWPATAPPPTAASTAPVEAVPNVIPAVVTTYPRVRFASLSELAGGTPVDFEYPTEGAAASLFKLGTAAAGGVGPEGDIVAFAIDCTHMGCPLRGLYRPEHAAIGSCACHFTTFDLTHRGMVVIGQATENLPQILLEIDGDDILAIGTLGILYGSRDNLADAPIVEGLYPWPRFPPRPRRPASRCRRRTRRW